MKLTKLLTDAAILAELGHRLAQVRLGRNLTQAQIADAAGVSKRTVERLENGASAQLSSFVRLARALDLIDGLERLLPEVRSDPIQQLRSRGKTRRRASIARAGPARGPFRWGDQR